MKYNPERGEVLIEIQGKKLVIANEFERFAQLSREIGARTYAEISYRLNAADPDALLTAVRVLAVNGDFDDFKTVLHGTRDLLAIQTAVLNALRFGVELDDQEGEAGAAEAATGD